MDNTAYNNLILWKHGSHQDIGYCAGSQAFADDVLEVMKERKQLEAENARLNAVNNDLSAKANSLIVERAGLMVQLDVEREHVQQCVANIARLREELAAVKPDAASGKESGK